MPNTDNLSSSINQLFKGKRIFIVTGPFGCGKTEFSLNLSIHLSKQRESVTLTDLDIVNMYFRSRQRKELLKKEHNIEVISSHHGLENIDLPALNPKTASLIRDKKTTLILDVGGEVNGTKVLGRFAPFIDPKEALLLFTYNPYRPDADSPEKVTTLISKIETLSKQTLGLLVANPNLARTTERETVSAVIPEIESLSKMLDVPFLMLTEERLGRDFPVDYQFNLKRFMKLPFESGALPCI